MAWLSNFSNRLKLTIPADGVDSSLTDFPVMINLSSSSGKTGADVTPVFDELGDDHQKRFAITENDGTTQCYIEIEYWDATEERAILWTKIPTIYSSVDTDIYFYWDSAASGNTAYVGDTGDTPAQNVWDDNFKLVMHMAQDPSGGSGCMKDSTINSNHGTPGGGMVSADLVDGKVGKAIDFDPTDDYINIGALNTLNGQTSVTWEAVAKNNADSADRVIAGRWAADSQFQLWMDSGNNKWQGIVRDGVGGELKLEPGLVGPSGVYQYIVMILNGQNLNLYVDVVNGGSINSTAFTTLNSGSSGDIYVGADQDDEHHFNDAIDEVRISNTARSVDWIKATYYSNWDDFIVFQQEVETNWLSDWAKRIKLTIDKDKIDSVLVDFPINITLSSDTGITNTDVTDVFTTISGSSKKIAITTSDGITQCPVEIERWDEGVEQANLWTKVPIVDSNENTVLYLYYDSSKSDNDSYVGDTGSTPAQNVWDDNFKLVMHMSQDPNGDVADAIKDSTSGVNHGTPAGGMTSVDIVDGKIGKAIDFDGNDDSIATTASVAFNGVATIDMCIKLTQPASIRGISMSLTNVFYTHSANDFIYFHGTSDYFRISITTVECQLSIVYDGDTSTSRVCCNGVFYDITQQPGPTHDISAWSGYITGHINSNITNMSGTIDEVRQSDIVRSDAWIKATYHSNWDELVSFGAEQEMPTHYYYGYITEGGAPVSRTVSLYNRSTGELVSNTISNVSTGYYYLTTPMSGEHFIVAIDDDAGKDYNALILDKLLPRGIE